jgi:outer membrane protein OmpA-like peptidoglycan-associated protein
MMMIKIISTLSTLALVTVACAFPAHASLGEINKICSDVYEANYEVVRSVPVDTFLIESNCPECSPKISRLIFEEHPTPSAQLVELTNTAENDNIQIADQIEYVKVQFAFDSSVLSKHTQERLTWLSKNCKAGSVVNISGFTDWIGPRDYNLKLSLKRAKAVEKYLKKNSNLTIGEVQGNGENNIIDKEHAAPNRRVELNITGK